MKLIKDERITSQIHKIGSESFFLLIGMLFVGLIYKTVIKDLSFESYQWGMTLIAVPCIYYTIRCIFAGIYVMPPSRTERGKFAKHLLLWIALGAMAWGLFLAIRNMFLYQGGVFNWLTIAVFLTSSIFFFILLLTVFVVIYSISGIKARKNTEE